MKGLHTLLMTALAGLRALPLIIKLLFYNNEINGYDVFRPHIGPRKFCGFNLNVQRARARNTVSPSVNVPSRRRATLCFVVLRAASRVRARLDHLF